MENNYSNFFENKKVIVTGGAGFIGSHICEELVKLKANVICLDNLSAGKVENLKDFSDKDNFRLLVKDVSDNDDEVREAFKGADIVFNNAASKKNICLINPHKDLEVNSGGTLNLLQLSMEYGVKKFIHASTGSVYGEPFIFPTTETHPFYPVSYYGVSKLGGERYVDVFHKLYGLDTTIIRYFHVYGPRQESNEFGGVVSIFLRKISEGTNPVVFGDGTQVRSFTWVKDLVNVNLLAAVNPVSNGKAYNAASGISVTINDLARNMIKILDAKNIDVEYGPPLIGDIMHFEVSNEAVVKDLGATFNTDFWGTLEIAISDTKAFLNR